MLYSTKEMSVVFLFHSLVRIVWIWIGRNDREREREEKRHVHLLTIYTIDVYVDMYIYIYKEIEMEEMTCPLFLDRQRNTYRSFFLYIYSRSSSVIPSPIVVNLLL